MMTVHVLHGGDGYTYLTRQVASGDVTRGRGESLSDYYVHDGNPPGRWVGEGLADLGVSGMVAEEQMRALFGEGRHPDADRIEHELVVSGAGVDEAMKATRLGRRFPRFDAPDEDPYESRLRAAFDQFRVDHDRSPEPGVERDLIRWNVARSVLADRPGESVPTDADVARFLAGRGSAQRQPVAGYDFVFTPVKSVSTLWALGDD
ncbi:MAG TPA: relaxase domain-containing protein, partial [Coriobacteriia bacterium]|nr:relaxase domain-containing protein [Coriobacteriia bacterium]